VIAVHHKLVIALRHKSVIAVDHKLVDTQWWDAHLWAEHPRVCRKTCYMTKNPVIFNVLINVILNILPCFFGSMRSIRAFEAHH
jgi:hypothetical protein